MTGVPTISTPQHHSVRTVSSRPSHQRGYWSKVTKSFCLIFLRLLTSSAVLCPGSPGSSTLDHYNQSSREERSLPSKIKLLWTWHNFKKREEGQFDAVNRYTHQVSNSSRALGFQVLATERQAVIGLARWHSSIIPHSIQGLPVKNLPSWL